MWGATVGQVLNAQEAAWARAVLIRIAPDEVAVLDELLAPPPWWRRRQSLGYGLDVNGQLIAPYLVVTSLWISSVLLGEVKSQAEARMRSFVKRVFGKVLPERGEASLNALDRERLVLGVESMAKELGMPARKAERMARAVVEVVLEDLRKRDSE